VLLLLFEETNIVLLILNSV